MHPYPWMPVEVVESPPPIRVLGIKQVFRLGGQWKSSSWLLVCFQVLDVRERLWGIMGFDLIFPAAMCSCYYVALTLSLSQQKLYLPIKVLLHSIPFCKNSFLLGNRGVGGKKCVCTHAHAHAHMPAPKTDVKYFSLLLSKKSLT